MEDTFVQQKVNYLHNKCIRHKSYLFKNYNLNQYKFKNYE